MKSNAARPLEDLKEAPSIPNIPDLTANNEIDVDALGSDNLVTYIKYPGIALGDVIWPNWRGCSAVGQAHDLADARVDVSEEEGYTEALGMPVAIPNALLQALNQGWAFYSYAVSLPQDPDDRGPESVRQFCYVGLRPLRTTQLPVVQLRESHDLHLGVDDIGSAGATAVVPPYQAMQAGDKVRLIFQGFYEGYPEPEWSQLKTLQPEDVGAPMVWRIPRVEFDFIEGGHADIHYVIEYSESSQRTTSPTQTFRIEPLQATLLPELRIDDYTGGPLDPNLFPNGLTVRIDPYPGLQVDDWLLLYWRGPNEAGSVVQALRLDLTSVQSESLVLRIEPQWLDVNIGAQVSVFYQYAREGGALTSQALPLAVQMPRELSPPQIEQAVAEGGSGEHKGRLAASTATHNGAFVNVPESVVVGVGESLEVHWRGHENGGRHVAERPHSGQTPKRFQIPSSAIAANMEQNAEAEAKRFEVVYRLNMAGGQHLDSEPFNLRITPLAQSSYPTIQCKQAQGNSTLSLASVPSGADLELNKWSFMAVGQQVTISATGINPSNQPVHWTIRNKVAVTEEEFSGNRVEASLPRDFLRQLKLNNQFSVAVTVSFDGGESIVQFGTLYLTLVA
ncbi:hypothetical protein [Pseudomonas akapageensis]|uniref:hypothetical protein n=1 Tax=Pseudomonas akapageensis TaxID=2609961 RepID=UPI00140ACF4A|nr:hypothetical protein [Pseudomonas akapageensis]